MMNAKNTTRGIEKPLNPVKKGRLGLAMVLNPELKNILSEKKALEESLEQRIAVLQSRIEVLEREKDNAERLAGHKAALLSMMGHEIRTPLHTAMRSINKLRNSDLTDQQKEQCRILGNVSTSMLTTLNDIADFSRIDSGTPQIEKVHFSLVELITDISNQFRDSIISKGLAFTIEIDHQLPDLFRGGRRQIRQVLTSLLANAIQFTSKGGIDLTVRKVAENNDGPVLSIEVTDTGMGLDPEAQARIVNASTQNESSTDRKFDGSGLRMSICQRIATLMGGTLRIESRKGLGSRFCLEVSLESCLCLENQDRALHLETCGHKVLLVDKNPRVMDILYGLLDRMGIIVCQAETVEGALECLRKTDLGFDCLILDTNLDPLPAEKLKRLFFEYYPLASLIYIGARAPDTMLSRFPSFFVEKPIMKIPLQNAVLKALRGKDIKLSTAAHVNRRPCSIKVNPPEENKGDLTLVKGAPTVETRARELMTTN